MKRIKNILFSLVLAILMVPGIVNAASASITVKTSGTAVVGNEITATVTLSSGTAMGAWEYYVNYDNSKLKLKSGDTHVADYTQTASGVKSKSYTLKFTALKSGNASINIGSYQIYSIDESLMSVSTKNASVKVMTQAELEASYSKNNNLSGISVDNYELSPAFNKDTLEYTVTVPSDVTSVNIGATKEDGTATVNGTGQFEVIEGSNVFELVVRAENGAEKTYKVTVVVEDLNPIEETINGKKYTIVKRKDLLEAPVGFVENQTKVNDIDVPALYSEVLDLYLVGVKDEEGNVKLAIVDNNKIVNIYSEVKSQGLIIYILDLKESSEFNNYIKDEITIGEQKVSVYRLSEKSDSVILYARSVEDGLEQYYEYRISDGSLIKYSDELSKYYDKQIQNYKYMLIGCLVFIVLLLFILIVRKPKRKVKKYENKTEEIVNTIEEKIDEEIEEEIEETPDEVNEIKLNSTNVYDIDLITDANKDNRELSKKELKRLRKEEKRKIKEFTE